MGETLVKHFDGQWLVPVGRPLSTPAPAEACWRRQDTEAPAAADAPPLLARVAYGKGWVYWLLCEAVSQYGGPSYDTLQPGLSAALPEAYARTPRGLPHLGCAAWWARRCAWRWATGG